MPLSDFRVLCFDVYGTLIDWESGMLAALQPVLDRVPAAKTWTRSQILRVIQEEESAQQAATPEMLYADVLAAIHPRVAARLGSASEGAAKPGSAVAAEAVEAARSFGASVGGWPAFPDTVDALRRLAQAGFKLVVLSNVDRASFAATNAGPLQGVPFDLVLTAQEIGSYKPDVRNFTFMLEAVQARWGVGRDGVLQTAQSQFHDHRPARAVGIRSAWIVRPGATMGNTGDSGVCDYKFDTLGEMADAVAESKIR